MSWAIFEFGKKDAVLKKLKEHKVDLAYKEETDAYNFIKQTLITEISVIKDNQLVRIEANGSMYLPTNSDDPVSCNSSHKLEVYNIKLDALHL